MIIKAYAGDGAWNLYEGTDVEYLGDSSHVHLTEGDDELQTDERFPLTGDDVVVVIKAGAALNDDREEGGPYRLVRWVKWFDRRDRTRRTVLITDGPVYICNDRGDTVERLR
jgi:hypothetical protein